MELTEGKCPNCGATVHVDPSKDAAICEYCSSPFVVEKAIKNVSNQNIHIGNNYVYNTSAVSNDTSNESRRGKISTSRLIVIGLLTYFVGLPALILVMLFILALLSKI